MTTFMHNIEPHNSKIKAQEYTKEYRNQCCWCKEYKRSVKHSGRRKLNNSLSYSHPAAVSPHISAKVRVDLILSYTEERTVAII